MFKTGDNFAVNVDSTAAPYTAAIYIIYLTYT